MAERLEGVSPTRMELLEIKKKTRLAKKGHKMLKEKRDALILEFFEAVKRSKGVRVSLGAQMKDGYSGLVKSKALLGTSQVKSTAMGMPESVDIEVELKNIMGVRVPKIRAKKGAKGDASTPLSSHMIDKSVKDWGAIIDQIMLLAEVEETIRRLAEEIKKTKRRVNALEYNMIPRLDATKKYIQMRLDEIERENFSRLKMVKAKKMQGF